MLSHVLEYCLFFMRRTRCRMAGRPVEVVRLAWVGFLGRTVDDGPLLLRPIQAGRQRIVCCVELTALLDNGSFA